jgi:hypothetical protein
MTQLSRIRFVVFTSEEGHKVAINPEHVRVVEPLSPGAKLIMSGPGAVDDVLSRRVKEPFDEVMRSLRDEARPRLPRE